MGWCCTTCRAPIGARVNTPCLAICYAAIDDRQVCAVGRWGLNLGLDSVLALVGALEKSSNPCSCRNSETDTPHKRQDPRLVPAATPEQGAQLALWSGLFELFGHEDQNTLHVRGACKNGL
jgi:hypothetical protein